MKHAFVIFGFVLLLAADALAALDRPPPPILIHAAAPMQAPMLFAPCPLAPRDFRKYEERKA